MTEQVTTKTEAPKDDPFDFSEFTTPRPEPMTNEEAMNKLEREGRMLRTWDFSDENLATGDTLRDRTPQEIYDLGAADRQAEIDAAKSNRLKKVKKGVVTAFRRLR